MSQCSEILAALADGEWHSVADIHRRAGFSRLNSRVSELRSRGHVIEHDTVKGHVGSEGHRYRLVGVLDEPHSGPSLPRGADGGPMRLVERANTAPPPPDGEGALPLIEHPDGQLALEVDAA